MPMRSRVPASPIWSYLWDPPPAKEAFLKAAGIAHAASDGRAHAVGCVLRRRHRGEFLHLIRSGRVDLVFANERELHSLYETADLDAALDALAGTRGLP